MSKTTLAEIKSALRIDFNDSDVDLQRMANAAEDHICNLTQRTLKELCERSHTGTDLPAPLKQAVIAIVGSWLNQPEATTSFSVNEVDLNLNALVAPYMRLC